MHLASHIRAFRARKTLRACLFRVRSISMIHIIILILMFRTSFRRRVLKSVTSDSASEEIFFDPCVTFVIPSRGRHTLTRALDSLLGQSVSKWKALVLFQSTVATLSAYSYPPHCEEYLLYSRDTRIQFVTCPGGTTANCAGELRNFALQFVTTDWVAFLDDDDTLSQDYIRYLLKEMRLNPSAELISFRMFDKTIVDANNLLKVIPEEYATDARRDHIGISFAFRRTHSSSDLFLKSTTEDYLFIQNFCYDSGRLCILSPYITYYVGGRKPENRVSAGNRTIIHALRDKMHFGHVVESITACFAPRDQDVAPGRPVRIIFSGDPRTSEQQPSGLKFRLSDTAKNCPLNYEGVRDVQVSLNFAEVDSSDTIDTIFVVHSVSQLTKVSGLAKQSFLWTTSYELKKYLISVGFDSLRVQVINPWNILHMNDFGPCALDNAVSVRTVADGEANQLSITLLDTRAVVDIRGAFQRFCVEVQLAGFRVTCMQRIFDNEMLLQACSADIVVFYFHDGIPEWLPVQYLILREKIVLFNSDRDQLLNDFFSNFAHSFDSLATALSDIVTISNEWNFFSAASRLAAKALLKVIDDTHHEEICLALDDHAAVRAGAWS